MALRDSIRCAIRSRFALSDCISSQGIHGAVQGFVPGTDLLPYPCGDALHVLCHQLLGGELLKPLVVHVPGKMDVPGAKSDNPKRENRSPFAVSVPTIPKTTFARVRRGVILSSGNPAPDRPMIAQIRRDSRLRQKS